MGPHAAGDETEEQFGVVDATETFGYLFHHRV